jgi:hypothetical protein
LDKTIREYKEISIKDKEILRRNKELRKLLKNIK